MSLTIESLITMVDVPTSDGEDCGEGSCLRAWNLFNRHRLGCVGRVRRLDRRLDPTVVHCALGTQGVEQAEAVLLQCKNLDFQFIVLITCIALKIFLAQDLPLEQK
ncbi:hypothetical protein AAFF_G00355220 [Aldrovandia affinis]|uniref:Uncharacterized protein n=1 Tax=Aldrovandia affinis TaxID=143900 RepID=A0AAD7WNL4_9TELE|nr:hypothetical protein AAFF_G00355220 [Aldrovandia affinis]